MTTPSWRRVPAVDVGSLLSVGIVPRMTLLYLARVVDAEGALRVGAGALADGVGRALGAGPFERRALAVALDAAVENGALRVDPPRVALADWADWNARDASWARLEVRERPEVAGGPFWSRVTRCYVALRWGEATASTSPRELAAVLCRFGGSRAERALVERAMVDIAERQWLPFRAQGEGTPTPLHAAPVKAPRAAREGAVKVRRSGGDAAVNLHPVGVDPDVTLPPVGIQSVSTRTSPCPQSASILLRTCLHSASTLPPLCLHSASTCDLTTRNDTTDVSRTQAPAGASEETDGEIEKERDGATETAPRRGLHNTASQGRFSFAGEPTPEEAVKGKSRSRRAPVSPDPVPDVGTPARRLYDIILADPRIRPLVAHPGEFVLTVLRQNPDLPPGDIAAQWVNAGDYLAREGCIVRDGRRFLRNQLTMVAERVASRGTIAQAPKGIAPVGSFTEATTSGRAVARSPFAEMQRKAGGGHG